MKRRIREEEEIGELNIVPYLDIVTNLVMFMLLSMAGLIHLGVLDVASPKIADASQAQSQQQQQQSNEPQLNLTVGIADKGFYVMGTNGVLEGPQDQQQQGVDTSRPPTVPKKGNDYDFSGLTDKLAQVKEAFPKELKLIIVAETEIPYAILVKTMDAAREKVTPAPEGKAPERKELFPVIMLSSMR
jgi:biopolymer transport protein TolR